MCFIFIDLRKVFYSEDRVIFIIIIPLNTISEICALYGDIVNILMDQKASDFFKYSLFIHYLQKLFCMYL